MQQQDAERNRHENPARHVAQQSGRDDADADAGEHHEGIEPHQRARQAHDERIDGDEHEAAYEQPARDLRMRHAAVLARQARQRDHEAGHEEESRRDGHAGEARQELEDVVEHGRGSGSQLLRGTAGVEHERRVIERHVRDEQAAKRIDIGLAHAGRADRRGSLSLRGGGRIVRHGHMVRQPQCGRALRPARIEP